jgi:large subunit ribosomal protein L29
VKYSEIKIKTESELEELAYNMKKALFSLRVQQKLNQIQSTAEIRKNRRGLARVNMRLSEIKKK